MDQQTALIEEQATTVPAAPERVALRDLEDGQRVRGVYAVRERELRRKSAQNIVTWLKTGRPDYVVAAGTRRPSR